MMRYVGEVYVIQLRGKWGVVLDDEEYVFYSMPIVKIEDDNAISPFSELVASVDRKLGDYMYKVFMVKKERMKAKGLL
jgi:hypothetical protein